MGRAYYRFGQDVALRLPNGQAFALQDAELGAIFGEAETPVCSLRGAFSAKSFYGLVARGVIPPHPDLQALAQPVTVKLRLNEDLAKNVGKDAPTLNQAGRRLSLNSLTDEFARKLLMMEAWHFVWAKPLGDMLPPSSKPSENNAGISSGAMDDAQEAIITEMVTDMASELWLAAEEAGSAALPPDLASPLSLLDAVMLFFEEEEWDWETADASEGLFRTVYDGQNGSWMCYTRILHELDQVLFYSVCPVSVPASALQRMTEYLCRVNADLSLGNFELDFSHNAVRFRTGVDVTDVGLAPLLFRNLAYQNLAVMDLYLPEILGIVSGKQSTGPSA
ncbi:MAG: YbjN domain-containing protein [Caldilineaceae bacterium]|nr:YbjN domain-containing protein [Caldilineaceae bacterium]